MSDICLAKIHIQKKMKSTNLELVSSEMRLYA